MFKKLFRTKSKSDLEHQVETYKAIIDLQNDAIDGLKAEVERLIKVTQMNDALLDEYYEKNDALEYENNRLETALADLSDELDNCEERVETLEEELGRSAF